MPLFWAIVSRLGRLFMAVAARFWGLVLLENPNPAPFLSAVWTQRDYQGIWLWPPIVPLARPPKHRMTTRGRRPFSSTCVTHFAQALLSHDLAVAIARTNPTQSALATHMHKCWKQNYWIVHSSCERVDHLELPLRFIRLVPHDIVALLVTSPRRTAKRRICIFRRMI